MFFGAWRSYRQGLPLSGMNALALDVILQHPEYHDTLEHPDRYRDRDYLDESNPFLHMSLHMALEEQLSIDQPPGIRAVFERLVARHGSEHDALHDAMECLGRVVWEAQRGLLPADPAAINDARNTI